MNILKNFDRILLQSIIYDDCASDRILWEIDAIKNNVEIYVRVTDRPYHTHF